MHRAIRSDAKHIVEVISVSLNDLLSRHNAPSIIDYMPIDTEGSERAILEAFDFEKYAIRVISVEHKFTENRGHIRKLLYEKGFQRVARSVQLFDDIYFRPDLVHANLKNCYIDATSSTMIRPLSGS